MLTATRLARCRRLQPESPGVRTRGQSLVEFALVLPIVLLVLLIGIDFGRVYLGYINLQQMARIAANYAANNPDVAWGTPTDPAVVEYREQVINDAKATNCQLPVSGGSPVVPPPAYSDVDGNGTTNDVGDMATVGITCNFRILTPVVSWILGNDLPVSASAEFPVKTGQLATGGGSVSPPTAAFSGTPQSGPAPLTVDFTDLSTGNPTAWNWDFDEDGLPDSNLPDPSWTYSVPGTYDVTLVVTNGAGSDSITRSNYVTVGSPLSDVSFTATPGSGPAPLSVQFNDTSTNSPISWEWDFENDGAIDSTDQNPMHTYTTVGTYSVKLTVTNAGGTSSTLIADLITVTVGTCTVPNFATHSSSEAQGIWSGAGFTTTVQFQQGNLPWIINSQSQVVGQQIPCNSPITVSKN